jgi:hypothetical protein
VTSNKIEFWRDTGCAVILTLAIGDSARVMHVGGDSLGAPNEPATAEIISYTTEGTISDGSGWHPAVPGTGGEFMLSANGRRRTDAVMLADGSVLVVGGEYFSTSPDTNFHTPNWECEIYHDDPLSPYWSWADSIGAPRRYHSETILLPDGRIVALGDEAEAPPQTGTDQSGSYEIFYPPCLFETSSTWAKRPLIAGDVTAVTYGLPFLVPVDHEDTGKDASDIADVVIMMPGTSTHSTNMTQRRVRLASVVHDDSTLVVAGPLNGRWAPPGRYMLILVDSAGVPSVADFVTVGADSGFSVASGETAVWFGDVNLDRDFEVRSGGTLEILPGTTVHCAEDDAANLGDDPSRIEILVAGQLLAEGEVSNRIVFTSSAASPTAGEWHGVKFQDAADMRLSNVENADFEYPVFAIGVDSLSGNIVDCSFTDSQNGDIYMNRDTRIPAGYQWLLRAPTEVVAANDDASPDSVGGEDPEKVELLVNGALGTGDPDGTGSRVLFRSETADDFTGDGWYGAIIQGTGWNDQVGIAALDSAEFRDARYPVSMFLAWSASVTNSWFHHYNKTAITDWASDATIVGNEIWRGNGMDDTPGESAVGRMGIHIASSFGAYHDNKVFHQAARGIWADFNSGWCTAQSQGKPTQTLAIRDNDVVGDRSGPTTTNIVGVNVSWACREQNVVVKDNNVRNWPGVGIRVRQSSDAIVKCNCLVNNNVGFHHRRDALGFDGPDGEDTEGYNYLQESLLDRNQLRNVHTEAKGPGNGSSGLYGYFEEPSGGNSTHKGSRIEKFAQFNTQNWWLDAAEFGRTDTAQANAWFDENGAHLTDSSTPKTIDDHNLWNAVLSQGIEVGAWEGSSFTVSCAEQAGTGCDPVSPPTGGARAFVNQGPSAEQAEDERVGASPTDELELRPTVFSFLAPRPNPTRGVVELWFDIPWEDPVRVEIDVYDVAGRRVHRILDAPRTVGRHMVSWGLQNEDGRRVSPGIYFARIVAGERVRTQRITVLR